MTVADNLSQIRKTIHKTATRYNRKAEDITLVTVSKRQSQDKIKEALKAGQTVFGENRVQEAEAHWNDLKKDTPEITLHLIGPLQTNKVKNAVALFDVIETVDREKLARTLAREMEKQNRPLPCFIQVNTGDEDQKSGIAPASLPDFLSFCTKECGLDIQGLMCIPPREDPPALHFALLRKLAKRHNLPFLSMGMSSDFEKAIALGATHIRIGTGVFGAREA